MTPNEPPREPTGAPMRAPTRAQPGAVALVGAGEYTDAMLETDRYLLETLGGAAGAKVVLLPTASGLERGSPERWNSLGLDHFAKLGVADIRPTLILDRASAADPHQLAPLRDADFFYFSGGTPQHVVQTMADSPAWELMRAANARGAVLAGCSAGAMALAGQTMSLRSVMTTGKLKLEPALGIVPRLVVFPHFDRMAGFVGQAVFTKILQRLPEGVVGVGVDEDTALVRLSPAGADGIARWRVMGRQTVSLFQPGQARQVLPAGSEITL